jgi:hypothetical protein
MYVTHLIFLDFYLPCIVTCGIPSNLERCGDLCLHINYEMAKR